MAYMRLSEFEIHRIVEYIKSVGVEFDAVDVEEDIMAVLGKYGFCEVLSEEDCEALRRELEVLGLAHEVAEVARVVLAGEGW